MSQNNLQTTVFNHWKKPVCGAKFNGNIELVDVRQKFAYLDFRPFDFEILRRKAVLGEDLVRSLVDELEPEIGNPDASLYLSPMKEVATKKMWAKAAAVLLVADKMPLMIRLVIDGFIGEWLPLTDFGDNGKRYVAIDDQTFDRADEIANSSQDAA